MVGSGAFGGGGGGGAATVMLTLASALPPGPVAVIVYVVDESGVTLVEPSGATVPTPGVRFNCVAFVEDQVRVAESPLFKLVEEAVSVTVGLAGGGACAFGGGGAPPFLPPPKPPAPSPPTPRPFLAAPLPP